MKKILVLYLLFLVSPCSWAAAPAIQQLQDFLAATNSLSTDFKQISFDERGNPAQTSFGIFLLQRPGKFRWDYQKPYIQQIVANDGKIWFFDADLEQVTIKKMNQSLGSTPALLLSGEVSLKENFTLEEQGSDADLQWIRLLPKDEGSGFKYILIGMENGILGGMEMNDNFGQLTRIYFTDVKTNIKIAPAKFEFTVPEGVDVFEE